MIITAPLPALIAITVGVALIVGAAAALFTRSWYDAALHRRSWIEHTVKPCAHAWATTGRWWIHNVIAHPLLAIIPPLGARIHDATVPPDDIPHA